MNDDKTSFGPARVRTFPIVFRASLPSLIFVLAFGLLLSGCGGNESSDGTNDADTSAQEESEMAESASTEAETDVAKVIMDEPIVLDELPEPEGEDGHFSISQIMQLANETKLYKELLKDELDSAVAERLLVLYSDLPTQSSPRGSDEDWNDRSPKLADAVKLIIAGDSAGKVELKKAVNCNSCHSRHKP